MPGRRPKPTALKELEGSRIRRKGDEPQPGGVPKCPSHLDAEARKEWRRISRELLSLGLLTSVDRAALAAYCGAWSRWVKAEKALQKQELEKQKDMTVVATKSGYPLQNPLLAVANAAMEKMHKFLIEFGMTPASRAKIAIDPGEKSTDPFADFMRGLGAEDITPNDTSEETELCGQGD